MKLIIFVACALASFSTLDAAESWPNQDDPRLIPVYHADRVWNAVATTTSGRVFVGFPDSDKPGPHLVEMDGPDHGHAFPDESWNSWKPGQSPEGKFVHVNAMRIGPDGKLWVIDAGATSISSASAVPGGARAIRIDLATNRVDKIYDLRAGVKPSSYIDDMRFNGRHAYLTDAGAPGLLVLDLKTGEVWRALDNDPTTTDARTLHADGKVLRDKQGKELRVHADQLEVSPGGVVLYYQPCSGPLARIETTFLDNRRLAKNAAEHARVWLDTPTTGGTAIAADGTIYYGDANRRAILAIKSDGTISTLISDPRLIWSDAMWIDHDGFLWIPATQQNLTPGFNGGKDEVKFPVWIYKMQIHARPPKLDHP